MVYAQTNDSHDDYQQDEGATGFRNYPKSKLILVKEADLGSGITCRLHR